MCGVDMVRLGEIGLASERSRVGLIGVRYK